MRDLYCNHVDRHVEVWHITRSVAHISAAAAAAAVTMEDVSTEQHGVTHLSLSGVYLLQLEMETSGRVKWACIVVASIELGQQLQKPAGRPTGRP